MPTFNKEFRLANKEQEQYFFKTNLKNSYSKKNINFKNLRCSKFLFKKISKTSDSSLNRVKKR